MKKVLVILMFFGFGLSGIAAQQAGEGSGEASQQLEEIVRPDSGGRLTLYGELYVRGWTGGKNGEMVVRGADLIEDDTFIGLLWEMTPFTGAAIELTNIFNANTPSGQDPLIYFGKAAIFSDIAGELGAKNMQAKLTVGLFWFDSDFVSRVDLMDTGDDMQHDSNTDSLNWRLDIGTKGDDVFPINFVIASDLDFGYSDDHSRTNFNNNGASGMFEIQSYGINIADVVTMDINAYYTGQFYANWNGSGDLANVVNKTQHSIGASLGTSIAVGEAMSIDLGAAAEFDMWNYGGVDARAGRKFSALDWQAGVAFIMANQFKVGLAMRQDAYNHAEYAVMNNTKAFSEFILGAAVHYLGLKEISKLTFFAGIGYSFGSLYSSALYKSAYEAGNDMYADLEGYTPGSALSADVGIGYHPTENAKMILGYHYGRFGLEAPDGAGRDFKGNWGKVYLKGAYIF
ncbi:MAG: hypothetical protein ACRCVN_01840 [Spirochaetia bacterium]